MSGRYYKDADRNFTMWVSNQNLKSPDDNQELDSASDVQSQYSDATTCESNLAEISDVRTRMRHLFESQSFTDVTFYQDKTLSVSISAHRAILAVGSPLFKKMLYGNQKKPVGENLELQISNLSFEAFTCIVKYLYTDEISFDNDALVQGILDGAQQFGIYSLVNKCNEYFENVELTNDNVCSKLQMSISNKIDTLKERCIEFIQTNTLSVIQSTEFHICSSATVRTICMLQSLNLRNEMELLDAVMQWLDSQPHHERKGHLKPLLKCIRFLNLTFGEMGDTLKKYPNLMTASEGLNIMLFLSNPPQNPNFGSLPFWCNKNMQSRCFFKENVYVSQAGLNAVDPNDKTVGKIFLPLKPDPGQGFPSKLTSLLQMKCISGFHEIKAIKLSFETPKFNKCRINSLCIKAHRSPFVFKITENVQIINSESVRVEFRKVIKLRQGDTLDIQAEARNIECCKFLQFDETRTMPENPHFIISISSLPKQGKLYFISEIEYGPQEKPEFPPKFGNKNAKNKK